MSTAVAAATRREIIAGYQSGQSMAALARQFRLAYGTIHRLCHRFTAEGEAAVQPQYQRCGKRFPVGHVFYRAACWLKHLHPGWGAPLIHLRLLERYGQEHDGRRLPSVRTIQVWFRRRGLNRPRSSVPTSTKQWAAHCHDIWQVDAKEQQRLSSAESCCWLTITDEHSTAILAVPTFPPRADHSSTACAGAAGPDLLVSTMGASRCHQGG